MKNRHILFFSVLLVGLFLIRPCWLKEKRTENIKNEGVVPTLIGKYCMGVKEVVGISDKDTSDKVFFLYNGYDCEDCIKAGFLITKKIDSLLSGRVIIIAVMTNPAKQQAQYKYYDYIYADERDTIRRELKYIPTPIMLHVNGSCKILATYFPNVQDHFGADIFIDQLLKYRAGESADFKQN